MLVETQNLLEFFHMENTIVQVVQLLLEMRLKPNLTLILIKHSDWLLFKKSQYFWSVSYPRDFDHRSGICIMVCQSPWYLMRKRWCSLKSTQSVSRPIFGYLDLENCERAVAGSSPWNTAVTQFRKAGSNPQISRRKAIYGENCRSEYHLAL